jgi:hypothetical protein
VTLTPTLGLLVLRLALLLVRRIALACALGALYVAYRAGRLLAKPSGEPVDHADPL